MFIVTCLFTAAWSPPDIEAKSEEDDELHDDYGHMYHHTLPTSLQVNDWGLTELLKQLIFLETYSEVVHWRKQLCCTFWKGWESLHV